MEPSRTKGLFARLGSPSLEVRVSAALVGAAVLTAASAGFFAARYGYDALKRQKQQDELVVAENIAAQVDEVLEKTRQTVTALAAHPEFQSMNADAQRDALTLVTNVTELLDGILVCDPRGRVVAMDGAEPSTETLLPASTVRALVEPVRKTGQTLISEVFESAGGQLVVAISAPIRRERALVGVVSGLIVLNKHSMGGIEAIRIGKSGYAYIVDASGHVIAHPQREKLFEDLREHPPVRALRREGRGVTEFVNREGVPVLAAFAPIEAAGWGVVVRQPTSESYAYARRMLLLLLAAIVVCAGLAAGLGVWLARRITRPLKRLVEGVNAVSDGALDTRIEAGGSPEIERLESAFNEMTRRLRRQMDDLRGAHAERLETERRLFQSEKLAAIGRLAAGLAHEINNPLNVISGFAELLAKQGEPGDARRSHAEEIRREAARCAGLVADLLNFAKPKKASRAPADLRALARETAALVAARARTQGVELTVEEGGAAVPVLVDPDQIKQAVLNLLINACEAMPSGGRLRVSCGLAGGRAELRVEDSGPGVPADSRARIFDPFFTTKDDGTGLGLPVTHSIVESHGGTLTVAESAGGGAAFVVALRAEEGTHAAAA